MIPHKPLKSHCQKIVRFMLVQWCINKMQARALFLQRHAIYSIPKILKNGKNRDNIFMRLNQYWIFNEWRFFHFAFSFKQSIFCVGFNTISAVFQLCNTDLLPYPMCHTQYLLILFKQVETSPF